jgi:hypothetical protein
LEFTSYINVCVMTIYNLNDTYFLGIEKKVKKCSSKKVMKNCIPIPALLWEKSIKRRRKCFNTTRGLAKNIDIEEYNYYMYIKYIIKKFFQQMDRYTCSRSNCVLKDDVIPLMRLENENEPVPKLE